MTTRSLRYRVSRIVGPDRAWVAAQAGLLVSVILAGPIDARRSRNYRFVIDVEMITGLMVLVSGAAIGLRAHHDLASSFSMSPTPLNDAVLVERGLYGLVRHPMYLSVVLLVAGYALAWRSRVAGAGALAVLGFLYLRVVHEEQKLHERYPGYRSYTHRVRWRIVPFVL